METTNFTEKKTERVVRTGSIGDTRVSVTFDIEEGAIKDQIQINLQKGNQHGSANYGVLSKSFSFQASGDLMFPREVSVIGLDLVESILSEFNETQG